MGGTAYATRSNDFMRLERRSWYSARVQELSHVSTTFDEVRSGVIVVGPCYSRLLFSQHLSSFIHTTQLFFHNFPRLDLVSNLPFSLSSSSASLLARRLIVLHLIYFRIIYKIQKKCQDKTTGRMKEDCILDQYYAEIVGFETLNTRLKRHPPGTPKLTPPALVWSRKTIWISDSSNVFGKDSAVIVGTAKS